MNRLYRAQVRCTEVAFAKNMAERNFAAFVGYLSAEAVFFDGSTGRFNSIWRLEAPHTWRIVFDKGEAVCAGAAQ